MTLDVFIEPLTGELVEATTLALVRADRRARDEITRIYKALRPLQERLSEIPGQTKVPPRRSRTDTQQRAVRCPRCSHWYEETG